MILQRILIGICVVALLAAIPLSIRNRNGSAKKSMLTAQESFAEAMQDRDFDRMERELGGVNVNGALIQRSTPLMIAVTAGQLDVMRWLIDKGADVNAVNDFGRPVLQYAVAMGDIDTVQLLVERGARVNMRSKAGDLPLTVAAQRKSGRMIEVLLRAGAQMDARNGKGETALMIAAQAGNVEDVRVLATAGADARGVETVAEEERHAEIARLVGGQ